MMPPDIVQAMRARLRRLMQRKEQKLLTVIMPVLNEDQEPLRTVESIYDTAPANLLKIIVIDDASDEPPLDFGGFEDVNYIRNERRLGSAACRQLGANLAETPYIFLIDGHMRFKHDEWCLKLINALEAEPTTAFCTVCLGLNEKRMDVQRPKGKYYGATIALVDEKADSRRPARNIVEAKWMKKRPGRIYEIPCILGANYAFSRPWFMSIRGLEGLQMWGTTEPFLSIKSWLAGGKCKIITDIEVGHKFRDSAPYRTYVHYLVYNKLLLCRTILPDSLGRNLINLLPRGGAFRQAMKLIEENESFIGASRAYYRGLFQTSFYDYCQRFDIAIPDAVSEQ